MKNFRNSVSNLIVRLRPLAIALVCALVVFSSATPALAFGAKGTSSPTKGLEQLDTVQKKSEEAISGPIGHKNDGPNVMKNSERGLNGVQGDANKENMISRENAKGNTIEKDIKQALEKVTP
jgi:hypothetical protein